MHDLETRLRAEFARPDPSPRRSAADLVAATRRIRRRRHALSAAVAAVAVAVVVAGTYLLVPSGRTGRPAPAASPSATDRGALISTMAAQGREAGFWFTDADHGFVMVDTCPHLAADGKCTTRLLATTDGGVTLEPRTLPGDVPTQGAMLLVFDARHLVLDRTLVVDPTQPRPRRWISADGGQHWNEVTTRLGSEMTTIPDGAYLYQPRISSKAYDVQPNWVAIGPDGVGHVVRDAPPDSDIDSLTGSRAVGGTWFAAHTGGGGQLTWSHDGGATWGRTAFQPSFGPITILGGDTTAVYADVWIKMSWDNSHITHQVQVSHDRGVTWTGLATPPVAPDVGVDNLSEAVTGHRVLVTDGHGLWVSDGGAFTKVDDSTLMVTQAGTGVIAYRGSVEHLDMWYSPDGRTWTLIPL